MKKYFIINLLLLLSCNNNTYKKNNAIISSDTTFKFNKNGTIKEKGILQDKFKIGWWSFFDSKGNLISKKEYLIIDDKPYENQSIFYDKKGNIDKKRSSYFTIELPDTLFLGKSLGYINNYSNINSDLKFLKVVIENKYSDNTIKLDTFSDGKFKRSGFGVFGNKVGKHQVKGTVLIKYYITNIISKDSFDLTEYFEYKYFKKNIYIKNNGTE